jgi:hypothetical protein
VTTGSDRLRQSLRRLVRFARGHPKPRHPDDQEPVGNWEQRTDERLMAIEQKLANQNRLLLISAVAIAADAVVKVFKL